MQGALDNSTLRFSNEPASSTIPKSTGYKLVKIVFRNCRYFGGRVQKPFGGQGYVKILAAEGCGLRGRGVGVADVVSGEGEGRGAGEEGKEDEWVVHGFWLLRGLAVGGFVRYCGLARERERWWRVKCGWCVLGCVEDEWESEGAVDGGIGGTLGLIKRERR
jgi:hypothetical protein